MSLAIKATGLVTSVGLDAPTSCCAIRAKVANTAQTAFLDQMAESISGHEVPLETPWRGRYRLIHLACLALAECIDGVAPGDLASTPILLCVAEAERPNGPDRSLLLDICKELGIACPAMSEVFALGRVGVAHALAHCRLLFGSGRAEMAVVLAVDSLFDEDALASFGKAYRLLSTSNSNGFLPGEGGGAILVGLVNGRAGLHCTGLGFEVEAAHIESDLPLRCDGLSSAVRQALSDAACGLHDVDYRIADLSGEHYYFKEAALVPGRLMRVVRSDLELWHPAECIGETGALIGVAILVVADAAARKGYAPGPRALVHLSADDGARAAIVLEYAGAP